MAWEPTIGKWADEENYVIKEPAWLQMLNASARYGGSRTLREILSWFGGKNLHGDHHWTLLTGCFLYLEGEDPRQWVGPRTRADILSLADGCGTIGACALRLLQREGIHEEFVEEFQEQFAGTAPRTESF